MDSTSWFAAIIVGQREAKFFEVTWFAEVFAAPVHPIAKCVSPGQKGSARGSANAVRIKLSQLGALCCQLVDVGR